MYYRLIAGVNQIRKIFPSSKLPKNKLLTSLGKTRMLVDTPTSDGGNTNNGTMVERFLNENNQEKVCSLIKNNSDRDFLKIL